MVFDKVYQQILLEHQHSYTNEDMDRFIRLELSDREELAKLVNKFIHEKGYADLGAFVVRADFISKSKSGGERTIVHTQYDVLAPQDWASYSLVKDPRLKHILGKFRTELWKYVRTKAPGFWAQISSRNSFDGVDRGFIGPPGDYHYEMEQNFNATVRITEYDPMGKYNVDDDVKEIWKNAVTRL